MKLLILTQRVDQDDDVLGFFHRWIEEFARHAQSVSVVALSTGAYTLPENVHVHSLGKERGGSRLLYIFRFYKLLWAQRDQYDTVLVHMNPEYVVLAGWYWRLLRKQIILWYTHRALNWKLRIATYLAHKVYTASEQSFPIQTRKLSVVGHGIDTQRFQCPPSTSQSVLKILSVGRIAPVKHCEVLIEAARVLIQSKGISLKVTFIGAPISSEDRQYQATLKKLISEYGLESSVHFEGSVPNKDIHRLYCESDITVNMSSTGGVDKAVLESMAAGRPVLASMELFREYFGEYTPNLMYRENDAEDLANKIYDLSHRRECMKEIGVYLQKRVREKADIANLVPAILDPLSQ